MGRKQTIKMVSRNVTVRLTSEPMTPEEPEGGEIFERGHEGHSQILEEFERLNPEPTPKPTPSPSESSTPDGVDRDIVGGDL